MPEDHEPTRPEVDAAARPDADGPDADGGPAEAGEPAAGADAELVEGVREALRGVKDPELGINIVDLGLVYGIDVDEERKVLVTMTLTSPGCPAGGQILSGAKESAESVEGVRSAEVNLVWKPFWSPDRMDPRVRASLGF